MHACVIVFLCSLGPTVYGVYMYSYLNFVTSEKKCNTLLMKANKPETAVQGCIFPLVVTYYLFVMCLSLFFSIHPIILYRNHLSSLAPVPSHITRERQERQKSRKL